MRKVTVITDSANDLPNKYLERYGVKFAPLSITFDKESFYDRVTLTYEDFYKRMHEMDELPRTSQPSPEAFYNLMKEAIDQGYEAVVITLSSGLSGSHNSACLAKDMFTEQMQKKIHIVDSLTASMGQGLLVLKAARLSEEGESAEKIAKVVIESRSCIKSIFTVDTFEYLLKGGRVTKVQAFFGTVLDIKPILHLDSQGKIFPMEKVRGKKKALIRMLEMLEEMGNEAKNTTLGISHFLSEDDALRIANKMKERFKIKEVVVGKLSASIGTHVGPGCIAIFFYT
jgi:DegV family protein with EDD domain